MFKNMHKYILNLKVQWMWVKNEYHLLTPYFRIPKITFKSGFKNLVISVASIYIHKIFMIQ